MRNKSKTMSKLLVKLWTWEFKWFLDIEHFTAWKVSKYSFFWSVFSCIQSNIGKHGPEKTSYLNTFHAVFLYITHLVLIYISIADLHDMKTLMYFMLLNILNGTQTKERVEEGNFPEEFWSNGSSETDYIDNESNLWMENLSRDRSNVMRIIQIVFDCAEIYKNFIMTNSHSNNRQRCSIKKGVLKYFGKFTENNLCQSLF